MSWTDAQKSCDLARLLAPRTGPRSDDFIDSNKMPPYIVGSDGRWYGAFWQLGFAVHFAMAIDPDFLHAETTPRKSLYILTPDGFMSQEAKDAYPHSPEAAEFMSETEPVKHKLIRDFQHCKTEEELLVLWDVNENVFERLSDTDLADVAMQFVTIHREFINARKETSDE